MRSEKPLDVSDRPCALSLQCNTRVRVCLICVGALQRVHGASQKKLRAHRQHALLLRISPEVVARERAIGSVFVHPALICLGIVIAECLQGVCADWVAVVRDLLVGGSRTQLLNIVPTA
jgi:hypothetical protein